MEGKVNSYFDLAEHDYSFLLWMKNKCDGDGCDDYGDIFMKHCVAVCEDYLKAVASGICNSEVLVRDVSMENLFQRLKGVEVDLGVDADNINWLAMRAYHCHCSYGHYSEVDQGIMDHAYEITHNLRRAVANWYSFRHEGTDNKQQKTLWVVQRCGG